MSQSNTPEPYEAATAIVATDVSAAIEPDAGDRAFARRLRREFAGRPDSNYIPSARSLTWLAAVLRVHRPRRVLEFGGGIGTITTALLRHPSGVERVVSTEDQPRYRADPGGRERSPVDRGGQRGGARGAGLHRRPGGDRRRLRPGARWRPDRGGGRRGGRGGVRRRPA